MTNPKNPRDMHGFLSRVESAFGILEEREFKRRSNLMTCSPETIEALKSNGVDLKEPMPLKDIKEFVIKKCTNYIEQWLYYENKHNRKGSNEPPSTV